MSTAAVGGARSHLQPAVAQREEGHDYALVLACNLWYRLWSKFNPDSINRNRPSIATKSLSQSHATMKSSQL